MKAKDIKENISIDQNAPGNTSGNPMDEDSLNKDICCNVDDILIAGHQENQVVEIAFLGNAYSLEVRINNGQKISMKQLNQLVKNGQIIIK